MVPDIMIKGLVASYLASPSGMDMIHNYISSTEGKASIREYLATPRGKETAQNILPLVLNAVDLPDGIRQSVLHTLVK